MKMNGFAGMGTGKLGTSIWTVNAGTQIVRQYQPLVANPSTDTQVGQRARFKLMSQLAAAMAPVIAIPKDGMLSPRNQFIKLNFSNTFEAEGTAEVDVDSLKITKSALSMVPLALNWRSSGFLDCKLASAAPANITSVVYAIFEKTTDNKLALVREETVTTPGADRLFAVQPNVGNINLVVYCYGIIAASEEGAAKFASYTVEPTTSVASLISTRRLTTADIKWTDTVTATMDAQQG